MTIILNLTSFSKPIILHFIIMCIFVINLILIVMIDRLMIKEAMKRNGTSVNEVANKMGISRVTLSTHINGNPSTEILLRIADAIGCPVTELFEQPKKDGLFLTCPHCGKNINIKVD